MLTNRSEPALTLLPLQIYVSVDWDPLETRGPWNLGVVTHLGQLLTKAWAGRTDSNFAGVMAFLHLTFNDLVRCISLLPSEKETEAQAQKLNLAQFKCTIV
jgi:hypothetical protein